VYLGNFLLMLDFLDRPFLIRFAQWRFDLDLMLFIRLLTLFINTAVILRLPKVFFEINATQVCLGVVTCHQPGGLIPVVSPWTFRQSLAG
jgi:hypothetical protein